VDVPGILGFRFEGELVLLSLQRSNPMESLRRRIYRYLSTHTLESIQSQVSDRIPFFGRKNRACSPGPAGVVQLLYIHDCFWCYIIDVDNEYVEIWKRSSKSVKRFQIGLDSLKRISEPAFVFADEQSLTAFQF
jgi:hypothetical protein